MIHPLVFIIFGGLALAFSLMVVLLKNPVSCAFSLIMTIFCLAGIYAALDAHLIAALQILVYAGAVMVLFVFVIMLLNADQPVFDLTQTHWMSKIAAVMAGIAFVAVFVYAFQHTNPTAEIMGKHTPEVIEAVGGNTKAISQLMFSEYLLPFELTSVLLLSGIIGAVALAKRKGWSIDVNSSN